MSHVPESVLVELSPRGLLLTTLFGEVRGQPIEGQVAAACSIRNRLHTGRWGKTYREVLLAWAQYSCLWPTLGGLNFARVRDFAQEIAEHVSTYTPTVLQLAWVADGVLGDALLDNTHGATHYHTVALTPPAWTRPPAVRTGRFGDHYFYTHVL